jgi:hypothetical protein
MTAAIPGYKYEEREVTANPEIWNEKTKTVVPVKSVNLFEVDEVLNSITLAMQAGVVSSFNWPQQFFASEKVFMSFIAQLAEYDETYRINDQWWQALSKLCEHYDEENFVSGEEIADAILSDAEENELLNWSKSKKLRYTAEQYENALYQNVRFSVYELTKDETSRKAHSANELVLGYCMRFADYPKLSEVRRTQANEEVLALLNAAKNAVKPTPAEKPAAKKMPKTK